MRCELLPEVACTAQARQACVHCQRELASVHTGYGAVTVSFIHSMQQEFCCPISKFVTGMSNFEITLGSGTSNCKQLTLREAPFHPYHTRFSYTSLRMHQPEHPKFKTQ